MLIKILIRFLKEKGLFEFIYANISLHDLNRLNHNNTLKKLAKLINSSSHENKLISNKLIYYNNRFNQILILATKKYTYQFLTDNNILDKFIINLKNYRYLTFDEYIKWCMTNNINCCNIINCAFDWEDTQEGHRFWSNLNYKFVDYILNKIK